MLAYINDACFDQVQGVAAGPQENNTVTSRNGFSSFKHLGLRVMTSWRATQSDNKTSSYQHLEHASEGINLAQLTNINWLEILSLLPSHMYQPN